MRPDTKTPPKTAKKTAPSAGAKQNTKQNAKTDMKQVFADGAKALIFDRNAVTDGSSISHAQNSGTFTIQQTGFYQVSFHGTLAPASGSAFPLTVSLYLQQQGTQVPGTAVQHTFHTSTDSANVAFSQIIQVTTVPTTIQVIGQGTGYFYGPISMSINKLGS